MTKNFEKLEVGRMYRTRAGDTDTITATREDEEHPFWSKNGYRFTTKGYWLSCTNEDGRDLIELLPIEPSAESQDTPLFADDEKPPRQDEPFIPPAPVRPEDGPFGGAGSGLPDFEDDNAWGYQRATSDRTMNPFELNLSPELVAIGATMDRIDDRHMRVRVPCGTSRPATCAVASPSHLDRIATAFKAITGRAISGEDLLLIETIESLMVDHGD
jgi:hypothetical protein